MLSKTCMRADGHRVWDEIVSRSGNFFGGTLHWRLRRPPGVPLCLPQGLAHISWKEAPCPTHASLSGPEARQWRHVPVGGYSRQFPPSLTSCCFFFLLSSFFVSPSLHPFFIPLSFLYFLSYKIMKFVFELCLFEKILFRQNNVMIINRWKCFLLSFF